MNHSKKYQQKTNAFIYKFEKSSESLVSGYSGKPKENIEETEKKLVEKSFEKIARLSKKAPKEKQVIAIGESKEKVKKEAIKKFVQENNLSAKFIRKNYNILIFFNKEEGIGRVMFKKRERPGQALRNAIKISRQPFYCTANTKKEAKEQAVEKLVYESGFTVRGVNRNFTFDVTLGGPSDLTIVKYRRKRR